MRPSTKLLRLLGLFCSFALIIAGVRLLLGSSGVDSAISSTVSSAITSTTDSTQQVTSFTSAAWWLSCGLLLLLALWDRRGKRGLDELEVERHLPGSLALGANQTIRLSFTNPLRRTLQIEATDHFPGQLKCQGLPARFRLAAGHSLELQYQATPMQRGAANFGQVELWVTSPLGLWQMRVRGAAPATLKVYPNFLAIADIADLSLEQQLSHIGLHLIQSRGEGMDFHQLREFREGDSLRQVDWKASARLRKAISREYQHERDQDILFLLDCGRRMRAKDGDLSHFDHSLNALLLTSHIALRQGDSVGLLSFAGSPRYCVPNKGTAQVNRLLDQVYDLHSSLDTSDYLEAAQQLMARHSKRSLVILITNVREEDSEDLLAACKLMQQRHLVVVASLREQVVEQQRQQPLLQFEDALRYCTSVQYLNQQQQTLNQLQGLGFIAIDAAPAQLHRALISQYLILKRSNRL